MDLSRRDGNILKIKEMNSKPSRFAYQARRHLPERIIQGILFLAAFTAVAGTIAIVVILVYESLGFFAHVSLWEFLTDTQWTPLFSDKHFGILPLLSGTLLTSAVALVSRRSEEHTSELQ